MKCPKCGSEMVCGAPHGPWPVQWECRACGNIVVPNREQVSKPKKPRLTAKVRRGLREWTAVMDALLTAPDDSELQSLSAEELADAEAAAKWIDELLAATEGAA